MVLTWITDAAPGDDRGRPPLIVMPSLFGAVDEWRTFFRGLDVDRPIFGLELLSDASYWTDEPTMPEIAARCVEVLLRDLSSRRFHLIGYSFGGRLAYELGQQLDAAGRAPSSIVIVDTPTTGPRRRIRWRDLRSMVANAPGWITNELQIYGAAALAHKIRNRWRFRVQAQGGLDGIFDVSQFTEGWRRRLFDSHRAFTTYRARPTGNRVVYLRSRVRSLIHSHRPDGGWGELVPAPRLTVLPIPGDHGSVLYPRWRADVACDDSTGAGAGRPLLTALDLVQQSGELRVTRALVVRTLALDGLRERRDRRRAQKIRQRDVHAELLPHPREHTHGEQRVATSLEKRLVSAEAIVTEQLLPDAGDRLLDDRAVGPRGRRRVNRCGILERIDGPTIDLAAGRERKGIEDRRSGSARCPPEGG